MSQHDDQLSDVLMDTNVGELTEHRRGGLRRAQAAILDGRWKTKLDELQARGPFHLQPLERQKRALRQLAQLNRVQRRRKAGGAAPLDLPKSGCEPGWRQLAALGSSGFAFGSDDMPLVVPASGNAQQYNMSGNSVVAATFPATGAIGVGAAAGGWCDLEFQPGSTPSPSPLLTGNRAAASLTAAFETIPLSKGAPSALMVSCGLQFQNPFIGLCSGDPTTDSMVWACSQATLTIQAVGRAKGGQWESKQAIYTQTLFETAGESQYDNGGTNTFGDPWMTDLYGFPDLTQPIGLSITMSAPPPKATNIYVNVAVEVSAWVEATLDSVVAVDSTGADTNLPVISAPDYLYPYPTTAGGTGPAIVSGLCVCGI